MILDSKCAHCSDISRSHDVSEWHVHPRSEYVKACFVFTKSKILLLVLNISYLMRFLFTSSNTLKISLNIFEIKFLTTRKCEYTNVLKHTYFSNICTLFYRISLRS